MALRSTRTEAALKRKFQGFFVASQAETST